MAFNSGEPPDLVAEKWTERELRELAVLQAHEPDLGERLDFWASQLLAAAINPWRGKRPAVHPKSLLPDWWKDQDAERSVGDLADMLKGMVIGLGGKVDGSVSRKPGDHHQR